MAGQAAAVRVGAFASGMLDMSRVLVWIVNRVRPHIRPLTLAAGNHSVRKTRANSLRRDRVDGGVDLTSPVCGRVTSMSPHVAVSQ